uniref:NADH-ubiquinone oxidoreductase chain 6 n=1 Tax=Parribacus antarcticus TaxID=196017 RepID=A0A515L344_PARAT|nr:NADH dehydrogenase subunit 6 [Parribacus antarcticus]QDM38494.1 NADH dehydrogenase subunit 6 [Parribacus antarcticus]
MLIILSPLIFFLSILFTQLTHPLSTGIILLIQTVLVALASGLLSKSFWFSYILFLIFLGGMLVLFIYVASLAANEAFNLSLLILSLIIFFTVLTTTTLVLTDPLIIPISSSMIVPAEFNSNVTNSTQFYILQIYNFPGITLTFFIIFYLLLTLIVTVKITSVFFGPLRFSS